MATPRLDLVFVQDIEVGDKVIFPTDIGQGDLFMTFTDDPDSFVITYKLITAIQDEEETGDFRGLTLSYTIIPDNTMNSATFNRLDRALVLTGDVDRLLPT
jgi:hypothetical protein